MVFLTPVSRLRPIVVVGWNGGVEDGEAAYDSATDILWVIINCQYRRSLGPRQPAQADTRDGRRRLFDL